MSIYEIWVFDETENAIKLDTDSLDLSTTFNVSDIADISTRKDTLTKSIKLKMTKQNNIAFGSCFHLNKVTDTSLPNLFGFNYNALRPVPCILYENDSILFRGDIRIVQIIPSNEKREGYYEATVTGHLLEFKASLGDLEISDIDFSDLKHPYDYNTINDSWTVSTRHYDAATNTFSSVPFARGTGYIYPHIDYGTQFMDESNNNATNGDSSIFNMLNYRPAVWLKEIFNRIIGDAGFKYEIKAEAGFMDKWNSLLVPNSDEKFVSVFSGFKINYQMPLPVVTNQDSAELHPHVTTQFVQINSFTPPPANTISPFIVPYQGSNKVLYTNRNFNADAKVGMSLSNLYNPYSYPAELMVALYEKPVSADISLGNSEWKAVVQKKFTIPATSTIADQLVNLVVGQRQWEAQKQYAIGVVLVCLGGGFTGNISAITYSVDFCSFSVPKDEFTQFTAEIKFDETGHPDIVTPTLPAGIKQIDFIKSVMTLMNLYCYSYKTEPKKLYFETYDDFYALTSPYYITSTALDWTRKIDLPSVKLKSKLDLPKKYLFTYKEDSDWINEDYKKKYNEIFGSFQSTDAFGVTDSKKIELIFSPTPVIEPAGTKRLLPALYKYDGGNKKPSKTNIRLLYYTGVVGCNPYFLRRDYYDTTNLVWTTLDFAQSGDYPRTGTYWYHTDNTVTEDLHFGRSKEYYHPISTPDYLNARMSYANFYIGQVTELTNPNISIIECDINLTEIDINNIDLKVPVFIDLGDAGHAYFKILSIEYLGSEAKSKMTALKIYNGVER